MEGIIEFLFWLSHTERDPLQPLSNTKEISNLPPAEKAQVEDFLGIGLKWERCQNENVVY